MSVHMGGYKGLSEPDLKQFAFCQGAFTEFHDERHRIGGRCFAYCQVLGELTLRVCRTPTMMFLDQARRAQFQQQLGEIGRQAIRNVSLDDGVSRADRLEVVDMAVADFSAKGRARDMQFNERPFPVRPGMIEVASVCQNFPHEYHRFRQTVRERVLAGQKYVKPRR